MASRAQDDGFHEIQLNGKQLVFVFMAATVVSVVIFLCGVLVGRGVRGEQTAASGLVETSPSALNAADDAKPDLATPVRPPTVVQPGDDPTKAPPPAPPNADGEASAEAPRATGTALTVKPDSVAAPKIAATPAPALPAPAKPAEAAAPARPAEAPASAAKPAPAVAGIPAADDTRQGWVIQVAATKTRGEADTLAKRLSAKGYSAFVLSNSANVFRVRVGGYKSRGDAEAVAAKLRKEERINPWVTR